MKLASFRRDGRDSYGAVEGNVIAEAPAALREDCPTLADCLGSGRIAEIADGETVGAGSVAWLPPIPEPRRILCVGINYRTHATETGRDMPAYPSIFLKQASALVAHYAPLVRPKVSTHFDYEGELALVIGKAGRHISRKDAISHIAGWSCFNDGSMRDFQKHSVTAGKNFVASGAFGPWIVTRDEAPASEDMVLETRVNGKVVQQSAVDLIYDVPAVVSYISTFTDLTSGDVIATGTPAGVGARRDPPMWLKAGDVVEVEISGVGRLENRVEDEA